MTAPATPPNPYLVPADRYLSNRNDLGSANLLSTLDATIASIEGGGCTCRVRGDDVAESRTLRVDLASGSSMRLHGWRDAAQGWVVEIRVAGGPNGDLQAWINTGIEERPDQILPPLPTEPPASGAAASGDGPADPAPALAALRCMRLHAAAAAAACADHEEHERSLAEEARLVACVRADHDETVEVVHPAPWGPPRVIRQRTGPHPLDDEPTPADAARPETALELVLVAEGSQAEIVRASARIGPIDPMERLRLLAGSES